MRTIAVSTRRFGATVATVGCTLSVAVGLLAPPIAYLPTLVASSVAPPAHPANVLPDGAAATTTVRVTDVAALPAASLAL